MTKGIHNRHLLGVKPTITYILTLGVVCIGSGTLHATALATGDIVTVSRSKHIGTLDLLREVTQSICGRVLQLNGECEGQLTRWSDITIENISQSVTTLQTVPPTLNDSL